jgi:hypothetical protein
MYFNSQLLPQPQSEYVAWIDVMGIAPLMGRSFDIGANFMYKLHIAVLQAPRAGVTVYPIMDGVYAVSPSQGNILDFVGSVFNRCAEEFLSRDQPFHQFLIRSAIACGQVIRGANVPDAAAAQTPDQQSPLTLVPNYKDALLMGLPMVQAHTAERLAPPFGVYVHESARSFAPAQQMPIRFLWWKWGIPANRNWQRLLPGLSRYFGWCRKNSMSIGYEVSRIDAHESMAVQYLQ